MKTSINGKPATWSTEVWALWYAVVETNVQEFHDRVGTVSDANYFTPRPYVDEYNRGSKRAGFTYTVGREVYQSTWGPALDDGRRLGRPRRARTGGRMKITAADRPFVLTFHASGTSYRQTAEEAQRLLDNYPAVTATANRVVLPGHNTPDPRQRATLRPATLGGGPAFIIERSK